MKFSLGSANFSIALKLNVSSLKLDDYFVALEIETLAKIAKILDLIKYEPNSDDHRYPDHRYPAKIIHKLISCLVDKYTKALLITIKKITKSQKKFFPILAK
jgi:hypothetical protein